jgi:hypothetical protein
MKRISLIVGIAALAAIAAPLSAQSNGNGGKYGRAGDVNDRNNRNNRNDRVYDRNGDGRIDSRDQVTTNCSWWEVNCTNSSSRTNGRINRSRTNTGWYQIGSDRYGNVIYERSTYDKKGRETLEIARRERNGRFVIIDKRRVDNQNYGRYDTRNDRRGNRGDNDDDDRYERHRR